MLAQERLGVQVFQFDVGAELAAQVTGRVAGQLPQLAQHAYAVADRLGQLVRPEDEQADENDDDQLPAADVLQTHARQPTAQFASAASVTWVVMWLPARV